MITCEHAQNLLEGYLNDELSPALVTEVDAHCLNCPGCRQRLGLLEACGNVVRLDLSEPVVSSDFTDRLTAILEEAPDERRWLQVGRWATLASGLVGVAAVIAVMFVMRPAPHIKSRVLGESVGAKADDCSIFIKGMTGWGIPVGVFGVTTGVDAVLETGEITANKLHDAAESENRSPIEHIPGAPLPEYDRHSPFQPFPDLEDQGETNPDDGGELI